jgi:transcriptional regulator with XRE-family HTH domain
MFGLAILRYADRAWGGVEYMQFNLKRRLQMSPILSSSPFARFRAETGVTQATLADKAGVDQSRISRIEKGEAPSEAESDKLLDALSQLGSKRAADYKAYAAPRTTIIFCSHFNDAPGTSTRLLLQHMRQTFSETLDSGKVSVLALPRQNGDWKLPRRDLGLDSAVRETRTANAPGRDRVTIPQLSKISRLSRSGADSTKRRHWLAEDAVGFEPVSDPEFP